MTRFRSTLAILFFGSFLAVQSDAQNPNPADGNLLRVRRPSQPEQEDRRTKHQDRSSLATNSTFATGDRASEGDLSRQPDPAAYRKGRRIDRQRRLPTSSPAARRSLPSRRCTKSGSTSCRSSITSKTTENCRSGKRSLFPGRKARRHLLPPARPRLTNNCRPEVRYNVLLRRLKGSAPSLPERLWECHFVRPIPGTDGAVPSNSVADLAMHRANSVASPLWLVIPIRRRTERDLPKALRSTCKPCSHAKQIRAQRAKSKVWRNFGNPSLALRTTQRLWRGQFRLRLSFGAGGFQKTLLAKTGVFSA